MREDHNIKFQEPEIFYEKLSSKIISVIIFFLTCLILSTITISVNYLRAGSGIYIFIGQILGLVSALLLSKFADARDEKTDKISIILLSLFIVTVVFSAKYYLSTNSKNFLTGFIPSLYMFHVWGMLPTSMSLMNKRLDNHFELTIIVNKFHKKIERTYHIPHNSKLLIKYTKMWLLNSTTSYNRLLVSSNSTNSHISTDIPIAPITIKGLQLLSVVMKLFPRDAVVESHDYGQNFGGFLSFLAPKLKGVRFNNFSRIKSNDERGEANSYNIDILHDRNFISKKISKKSLIAKKNLFMLLIWGIIFQIILIIYLIFFGFITYTAYVKWGIIFGVVSFFFELILFITIIYSFQKFIFWPVGLLIGDFNFIIDNEKLIIYYKRLIRSPRYIFPINLNPYLKTKEDFLCLELKSDSGVYCSLKIGVISEFKG